MVNYYYNYAIVNKLMGYVCLEIRTTSANCDGSENEEELYVRIDVYSEDYIMKYYDVNSGKWFYDAEMINEWTEPVA